MDKISDEEYDGSISQFGDADEMVTSEEFSHDSNRTNNLTKDKNYKDK